MRQSIGMWMAGAMALLLLTGCTGPRAEVLPDAQKNQSAAAATEDTSETQQVSETMESRFETGQIQFEQMKQLSAGSIVDVTALQPEQVQQLFYAKIIEPGDAVFTRINGCSYRENDNVALSELRYIRTLHYGFDGKTHVGEMIVHASVSEDVIEIFQKLYEAKYPIEQMRLVDDYDGDDNRSMADNNSSAFNYRYIAASTKLSNHSYRKAIDINPFYNPYIYTTSNGVRHIDPAGSEDYANRNSACPYMIDHEDLCYQLFTEHGFTWGGDWKGRKDYQHFEHE